MNRQGAGGGRRAAILVEERPQGQQQIRLRIERTQEPNRELQLGALIRYADQRRRPEVVQAVDVARQSEPPPE